MFPRLCLRIVSSEAQQGLVIMAHSAVSSQVAAIVPRSQVAKYGLFACADYYMQRTKSPRAKRGSFEKEIHS